MLGLLHVKSMVTFLRVIFLSNISKVERPWAIKDSKSPFHLKIFGMQKGELEKVSVIKTEGLQDCPLAES